MLASRVSKSFRKDFELAKKRGLNLSLIDNVMALIVSGKPLPAQYKNHKLKIGKYKDCQECHITPDWLLIYEFRLQTGNVVFIRTGTHSDLF
jgi:mRNA interferase YafQ